MSLTEQEYQDLLNKSSPEGTLQKDCEDYLKKNLIQYLRLKSMKCPYCNKWFGSKIYIGFPDLGIISNAGMVYVELKSKRGRLETAQKTFFQSLPRYYQHKYIIRNIEDFQRVMNCIQIGKRIPKKLHDRIIFKP